jgi:hypothetical protein
MPPDPQVAHLGGEGEGKDRGAVVVDGLERLVLDKEGHLNISILK